MPPGLTSRGRVEQVVDQRQRYSFIPFGGRRGCVGQSCAELEAVLVLAAITQQYRLELTAVGMPRPGCLRSLETELF